MGIISHCIMTSSCLPDPHQIQNCTFSLLMRWWPHEEVCVCYIQGENGWISMEWNIFFVQHERPSLKEMKKDRTIFLPMTIIVSVWYKRKGWQWEDGDEMMLAQTLMLIIIMIMMFIVIILIIIIITSSSPFAPFFILLLWSDMP